MSRSLSFQDDGIGLDGTESEFEELLAQAASLTDEEARTELVGCARYGETDAVRAILDKHEADGNHSSSSEEEEEEGRGGTASDTAALIDCTDDSGNTAVHMACRQRTRTDLSSPPLAWCRSSPQLVRQHTPALGGSQWSRRDCKAAPIRATLQGQDGRFAEE